MVDWSVHLGDNFLAEHTSTQNAVFLRWVGGKRWLIPTLKEKLGRTFFKGYREPFVGSGSLFLNWGYSIALRFSLSDIEPILTETLRAVRSNPQKIIRFLSEWTPRKKTYLSVRMLEPNGDMHWNAARFIFLNRLSWNGVYRVNSQGRFNVPYGAKEIPRELSMWIKEAARRLRLSSVCMRAERFAGAVERSRGGDILVLDPPYVDKKIGRIPNRYYNCDPFTWKDQEELARLAIEAVKRGVKVVVTPGNGADALYPNRLFGKTSVFRAQNIAADLEKRSIMREPLLISRAKTQRL